MSKRRKKKRRLKIIPVLVTLFFICGLVGGGIYGAKYLKNKELRFLMLN